MENGPVLLIHFSSDYPSPFLRILSDAVLILLLAARIHGTGEAVRASAKSCVKKLPRSNRDPIYSVINSVARWS